MSLVEQAYRTNEQARLGYLSDRIQSLELALANVYGATTNGAGGGFAFPYTDSVPPEFLNHLIFYNTENGGQTASKLELENFGDDLKVPNKVKALQYTTDNTTMLLGEGGTTTIDFQNNPCINIAGFTDPTHLNSLGGNSLVVGGVGPNLTVKGLVAGANTSITSNPTTLQIHSTTTTLGTAGGVSLVNNPTGPGLVTKGISAGTGVSLSDFGSQVEIAATGTNIQLYSTGTGEPLLYLGGPVTGPSMGIKSIEAGSGITVTDVSGSQLRIDSTSGGVTTLNSTGTGQSLLYSSPQVSPTMYIKSIEAGTGISVTDVSGSQLRIDSTITGTSLAGTGSGYQTLVYSGSAPNFQTYDVQASGDGTISIANNGTYLTWSSICNLSDTGAGGASLVYSGTAPNHIIKPIIGGGGCTVTDMGTYIQITVP